MNPHQFFNLVQFILKVGIFAAAIAGLLALSGPKLPNSPNRASHPSFAFMLLLFTANQMCDILSHSDVHLDLWTLCLNVLFVFLILSAVGVGYLRVWRMIPEPPKMEDPSEQPAYK